MGNKSKGKTDCYTGNRRPGRAGASAEERLRRKYRKALKWAAISTMVGVWTFGVVALSERWRKGVA